MMKFTQCLNRAQQFWPGRVGCHMFIKKVYNRSFVLDFFLLSHFKRLPKSGTLSKTYHKIISKIRIFAIRYKYYKCKTVMFLQLMPLILDSVKCFTHIRTYKDYFY